jgi:hypothetical protein
MLFAFLKWTLCRDFIGFQGKFAGKSGNSADLHLKKSFPLISAFVLQIDIFDLPLFADKGIE